MVILKELQDLRNMLEMRFPSCIVYEDVIKEDKDIDTNIGFQKFINQALKGGMGIRNSKRHNQEFMVAFMGAKSCLRNAFLFHPDLMVSRVKIQFV